MMTRSLLNVPLILCLILFMGYPSIIHSADITLIVRGDDMGMTQGSLIAFEKAFNEGVLTCASIIVPTPWFEAAADLIRKNPGWCIGVHLTLIGEWLGYRWRPVLPWNEIPSLVDEDGFLYRYPEELWDHKPNITEVEAELRAQVALAIKKGINVQYIDTHYMGYQTHPGLREVIRKIAQDYDIPVSGTLGEKRLRGIYTTPVKEKIEVAVKILENLEPGLWLWVFHPGINSSEHNALVHTKPEHRFVGDGVGKHRAAEAETLKSKELKSEIAKKGIILTNYRELWEKKKAAAKINK